MRQTRCAVRDAHVDDGLNAVRPSWFNGASTLMPRLADEVREQFPALISRCGCQVLVELVEGIGKLRTCIPNQASLFVGV